LTGKPVWATMILTLFLFTVSAHPEETPTAEALGLTLYFDGFVLVEYSLKVDPTLPLANTTMLGQVLTDITVVDESGLPLDYAFTNGKMTIYSLGAELVKISYFTQDLTTKEGRYWTLQVVAPTNTTIVLPPEASIISLNQVPEMIESTDGQVLLVMPAGLIEVTYVIGVVGTKEHAQVVLMQTDKTIVEIKSLGIIVTEAEAIFQEATEAFNSGSYAQAESLGYEARDLALMINRTAATALTKTDEAASEIVKAENEGRITGLDEARDLLDQANDAYSDGDYEQACNFADQAKTRAQQAARPFPFEVLGAVLAVAVAISLLVYRFRRSPDTLEPTKETRIVDVEKILGTHDLRDEEREAIQFLAENNGEAFEAELYERLELPRTTTWRMVKRLERMGIVATKKFRRQNIVSVRKRYEVSK